jgi:hypothetical protein
MQADAVSPKENLEDELGGSAGACNVRLVRSLPWRPPGLGALTTRGSNALENHENVSTIVSTRSF